MRFPSPPGQILVWQIANTSGGSAAGHARGQWKHSSLLCNRRSQQWKLAKARPAEMAAGLPWFKLPTWGLGLKKSMIHQALPTLAKKQVGHESWDVENEEGCTLFIFVWPRGDRRLTVNKKRKPKEKNVARRPFKNKRRAVFHQISLMKRHFVAFRLKIVWPKCLIVWWNSFCCNSFCLTKIRFAFPLTKKGTVEQR